MNDHDRPVMVSADGVYKDFKLPHEKTNSVKGVFTNPFRGRRHVERQHALKDINIDVVEGEFFGIVGRNGSGKSTLLKLLAGIYQPTKGQVSVRGRLMPFIELGVGFNPELTGRENVFLSGALLGFSEAEMAERYDDIVAFAELKKFMDQKLKNYSSGMVVRLAFSVAIQADADILLIDEVLAVGDAAFQRKCFNYFQELKKQKKTVVFVTHEMNAVREYCDRAILIGEGKVLYEGEPEMIAEQYHELFAQKSDQNVSASESTQRSGNRDVEYKKVSAHVSRDLDKPITITAEAVCNVATEAPIFGFAVKAGTGAVIMGTNTKLLNLSTKDYKKGEKFTLRWEIPNILNDGQHTIDVGAQSRDGTTRFDRWNDAVKIDVYRRDKTPYPVNPPVEFREGK